MRIYPPPQKSSSPNQKTTRTGEPQNRGTAEQGNRRTGEPQNRGTAEQMNKEPQNFEVYFNAEAQRTRRFAKGILDFFIWFWNLFRV